MWSPVHGVHEQAHDGESLALEGRLHAHESTCSATESGVARHSRKLAIRNQSQLFQVNGVGFQCVTVCTLPDVRSHLHHVGKHLGMLRQNLLVARQLGAFDDNEHVCRDPQIAVADVEIIFKCSVFVPASDGNDTAFTILKIGILHSSTALRGAFQATE